MKLILRFDDQSGIQYLFSGHPNNETNADRIAEDDQPIPQQEITASPRCERSRTDDHEFLGDDELSDIQSSDAELASHISSDICEIHSLTDSDIDSDFDSE